ncbi:succinate dehydrogenase iron-sulfur subunit [Candidatus Neptunochlamydia vexilliferae]|uniref:succinate dehydrogenase n=1 Tax=Candidatus Neptunichlamydia vexilliferae TaxID=1651774 RepID=A0ABS0B359_9BACT|nr:succinate dehydrogenase iron-sulfur subunit [Candidatus Neptunochlamydia vexilliferae]MBF5060025.1 Succinate dehydrogenase iron-sulfur subunit [Candidatus Neptunochlamydia vexilliferae]
METFILKIYRGKPNHQYWEEFELELVPYINVISALMEIQKNPINRKGEKVTPVTWEQGCLEEVCGSCSMLINGRPRQACTAIVEPILKKTGSRTITLAPFTKFPLVRDLVVNRSAMFENLKKTNSWISADGSFVGGFGPKISQERQEVMYTLSTCMTCGCCSEACPQVNNRSTFMGPAPISQVRLFNLNPAGEMEKATRLHTLMQEGGISECGNAQNCVQVCPKEIPLTESIADTGREVSKQALKDIFGISK